MKRSYLKLIYYFFKTNYFFFSHIRKIRILSEFVRSNSRPVRFGYISTLVFGHESNFTSTYLFLYYRFVRLKTFSKRFLTLPSSSPGQGKSFPSRFQRGNRWFKGKIEKKPCVRTFYPFQTLDEVVRTQTFGEECLELLKHAPNCRLPFNKFIPSYHHHFGRQCRLVLLNYRAMK